MTIGLPATEAVTLNWRQNAAAIGASQPELSRELSSVDPAVAEWLYARDGYLTAFVEPEQWWTGCSVPLAAARAMLSKMDVTGVVACFLEPTHAGALRASLERLRPQQAVIVVQPDVVELARALHCDDFSTEIATGRLWFVTGEDWPAALRSLLSLQRGLPTPSSFIRLPTAATERIEQLVGSAQSVFGDLSRARAGAVHRLRESWRAAEASPGPVGIIAPSQFRLWDDAAGVLAETLAVDSALSWPRFDPDQPTTASPVALAEFASRAGALVSADLSRAEAPQTVPDALQWVTWVTTGLIPPFARAGVNDRLILADPQWQAAAQQAGWPEARIAVAGWPALPPEGASHPDPRSHVWMIEDTAPILADKSLDEFSSHRLLWEAIESELRRQPLLSGGDPDAFLSQRMRQIGIAEQGFDRRLFLDRLIRPALQHGVARLLVRAGVDLRLAGRGWELIDDLRSRAAGPVTSRNELYARVRDARVIVHTGSSSIVHPMDRAARPVIAAAGHTAASLVDAVQRAMRDPAAAVTRQQRRITSEPLSAALLSRLLQTR